MIDAYHRAAVGGRDDVRHAAEDVAKGSPQAVLLEGVLAQYEGDVEGAVRILRRQVHLLAGVERAAVADILAPILVMRHENDGVLELAEILDAEGWLAAAFAFRALAAADAGNRADARKHAEAASLALIDERDEVVRFRVLQRLARTAFYLDEHERAVNLALEGARLAVKWKAWRSVAAGYSIAYNVHHTVTGDVEESARYAALWHEAAVKSGDESFVHAALVAEYEFAVQLADDERVERLDRIIRSRLLPQQYTERFPLALSHALVRGASDVAAMRTILHVLGKIEGQSTGQAALCTALIALADAASAADDQARASVRTAISQLGRPLPADPAYERRYRRLARATISAACMLLRDEVRAARIVATKEAREGHGEHLLPTLMRERRLDEAPPPLRGIARVFARAYEMRHEAESPAGLTKAEMDVLRLLGYGWSAGRIAAETHRSVNTIYNHSRAILAKLEASHASEAVAIARERGLLR
jgi:DNA-binding CsgD family transcriptional regulator